MSTMIHRQPTSVTIVGASVAGLYGAYHLARQGVRVRVYEAQAPFRPAARTLIVTPAFLRLLDFDAEPAVLNRTRVFELISRSTSARIVLDEPDVILDRARFMALLARRASEAGTDLAFGHYLEEMRNHRMPPFLRFRTADRRRQVASPLVVGADGVDSRVAQGAGREPFPRVALLQARVRLPRDLRRDVVRVWFDREATRFFLWLIPESADVGVAGLIAETPQEAEAALDRFLTRQGLSVIDVQEDAWVPLPPLRASPPGPWGEGRVLLVGDAAGQVKATTVGGVVTGMRGALAAVRALTEGVPYRQAMGPLWRELMLHAVVRRVLDGFTDEDYDRLLALLNGPARRVLARYHRDGLARMVWRLLLAQPGWLVLGARALLRWIRGEGARALVPPRGY